MSEESSTSKTPELPTPSIGDVQLLLKVIQHADFKSNFGPVATDLGVTNGNTAQKKFKKLVENYGMQLVDGQVTTEGAPPKVPKSPKTPKAPRTPRKRKSVDVTATENGQTGEDEGDKPETSPPKRKATGGRKKKVAAAEQTDVKDESKDDDAVKKEDSDEVKDEQMSDDAENGNKLIASVESVQDESLDNKDK